MGSRVSRRVTLAGVAGVPLLAACGDEGSTPTSTASESATPSPSSSPTPSPTASPEPTRTKEPVTGLTPAQDVPVGGGRVLADEQVVVTQPTAGEFRAFSSTCTHRGCAVAGVADGTINCTCHGSRFSITDGSVATGPATSPLPAVRVKEQGGQVVRA